VSGGRRGRGAGAREGREGRAPAEAAPARAVLVVQVQPRAARSEVAGWHGEALKLRLAAPPVDGAANQELVRYLAERLGMRRADVQLLSGRGGRRKRVEILGLTLAQVWDRLGVGPPPT